MSTSERAMPPLDADERTTLESWLSFYRSTLAQKCDGLTEDQLREASVAPSPITLLGLVQHMAEVERNWFRRVLAQEDAPPIFAADARPGTADGGFDLDEAVTYESAVSVWQAEVNRARRNCAARALEDTSPFMGGQVTLRWIYTHMIGEYARHCGHADLIRERVDGRTGV
ncbi:DinB family protein [Streptomyces sp. AK02-01A]|uniref:DinB family protein n=1 Tax=Streptomyces sp. AK02-01A TaxID=3028648 RepID=UPI0029B6EB1A|nr:DinB family protein [Streptomyces sp. AK02-01A]MDX3851326.1 DinB family protein [Streptomyces sp. AK02-01A]